MHITKPFITGKQRLFWKYRSRLHFWKSGQCLETLSLIKTSIQLKLELWLFNLGLVKTIKLKEANNWHISMEWSCFELLNIPQKPYESVCSRIHISLNVWSSIRLEVYQNFAFWQRVFHTPSRMLLLLLKEEC